MSDVVSRAKAFLQGVTEGPWECRTSPSLTYGSVHAGARSIIVSADAYHFGYADLPDAQFIAAARSLVPELAAEIERLHSWDGLMSMLDEHYPEDIFPTMGDTERRDPGPRIISLVRRINEIRSGAPEGEQP